ncbi:uncharacterized protein Camp [Anabrus simplex]|uniref:uncharacterized protein Camp n=1 Tax=Anabrus simplex TaxID=316456 RepID=UPI0035A3A12C
MPSYCSVPLCKNQGSSFSFHQFPQNKEMRKKWLHTIRRKHFTEKNLTENIKVCSHHFQPGDFTKTLLGERARLKPGAVPSLFPWTTNTTKRRKRPYTRKSPDYHDKLTILESSEIIPIEVREEIVNIPEEVNVTSVTPIFIDVSTQTNTTGNLVVEQIMNNPNAVLLYTGFADVQHFNLVFAVLGENRYNLQIFPLEPRLCFLLTVMKLRTNKSDQELGLNFGIHKTTVGRIFNVWINFMYCQFKELNIWPDRETVLENSPLAFRQKYPSTRVIIDATEITIAKPKNPTAQQATFSTYKNANTTKVLIGINPSGFISFISDAYGGAISDRQLFIRSGMLDLLEEGDSVMADRGFNIQDLLCTKGVTLNIPPFLKGKRQFTPSENIETRRIASKRIHIERAIGLAKTCKILQSKLHVSKIRLSGRIIFCTGTFIKKMAPPIEERRLLPCVKAVMNME